MERAINTLGPQSVYSSACTLRAAQRAARPSFPRQCGPGRSIAGAHVRSVEAPGTQHATRARGPSHPRQRTPPSNSSPKPRRRQPPTAAAAARSKLSRAALRGLGLELLLQHALHNLLLLHDEGAQHAVLDAVRAAGAAVRARHGALVLLQALVLVGPQAGNLRGADSGDESAASAPAQRCARYAQPRPPGREGHSRPGWPCRSRRSGGPSTSSRCTGSAPCRLRVARSGGGASACQPPLESAPRTAAAARLRLAPGRALTRGAELADLVAPRVVAVPAAVRDAGVRADGHLAQLHEPAEGRHPP